MSRIIAEIASVFRLHSLVRHTNPISEIGYSLKSDGISHLDPICTTSTVLLILNTQLYVLRMFDTMAIYCIGFCYTPDTPFTSRSPKQLNNRENMVKTPTTNNFKIIQSKIMLGDVTWWPTVKKCPLCRKFTVVQNSGLYTTLQKRMYLGKP